MLPLKLQIPSLLIAKQEGLTEGKIHRLYLSELEALNKRRL